MNQYTDTTNPDGLTMVVYHKKTDEYFLPAVLDGVKWELHWKGAPGKLTFKVYRDDILKMEYGDTIDVSWNGKQFFHGFIFTKKRSKDKQWDVTAYDQMRYLLNKDTFAYTGKKANEVIKELAEDFGVLVGDLDDTGFTIDKRREPNVTILDMCQNALDITMIHTNRLFALYDDCGKLMLKDIEAMKSNLLIDSDTAQDYSYTGSIDKGTYNLIKLDLDDGQNGHKTFYSPKTTEEYEASESRKQWGVLQYYASVNSKKQSPQDMADHYLKHFNRVGRTLSIKGAAGDLSIRGGSMLWINIALGETDLTDYDKTAHLIIVDSVTHSFSNHEHTMDMDVRSDIFTGNSSGSSGGGGGGSRQQQTQSASAGGGSNSGQAADPDVVNNSCSNYDGAVMPDGSNGCVEADVRMGSWWSPYLKQSCDANVVDVGTLINNAPSGSVIGFDAGELEAGDTIVYATSAKGDCHVVIYDGNGGYWGNSSSLGYIVHRSDYTQMGNGYWPDKIIKTSRV